MNKYFKEILPDIAINKLTLNEIQFKLMFY